LRNHDIVNHPPTSPTAVFDSTVIKEKQWTILALNNTGKYNSCCNLQVRYPSAYTYCDSVIQAMSGFVAKHVGSL